MATPQPCDHTSVGILVFREGKLLLIDRNRPPLGLAAPAGHVDKHGDPEDPEERQYRDAALAELYEETGLITTDTGLVLLREGRKENPCRRPDGSWHYWRIYVAEAAGDLKPSTEETRGAFWCTREQMEIMLSGQLIMREGGGGLEPVWLEWFTELNVLDLF